MTGPLRFLSTRADRRLLACLILVAVGLLVRFPIKYGLGQPFLMDYNVYRFAAELIRTDQGVQLYDAAYHEGMLFRYAPIWALLWTPLLGYVSTHAGAVLWSVATVLWIVITLWCAVRIGDATGRPMPWWAPAASVILLLRPLMGEFGNGQADLWWAGMTGLFVYFEVIGRRWTAALCLAMSIALKLTSVIFLPYVLVAGRWRTLLRTGVCLGIVLVGGSWLTDPHHHPLILLGRWVDSLAVLTPQLSFRIGDQSFLACLARFLTDDGYGLNLVSLSRSAVIGLALALETALFALVLLPRRRFQDPQRFTVDAAMLMLLMVLASPSGWMTTYTVMLLPLCFAVGESARTLRDRPVDALSVALGILAGLFSLLTHSKVWKAVGLPTWRTESYVFLVFMITPLLGLSLFAFLWRRRQLWFRATGTL